MLIKLEKDGSIEFNGEVPNAFLLRSHTQDTINPKRFIPKFLPCASRENNCGMSACGQRPLFNWKCLLLVKEVNVKICTGCTLRNN